MSMPGPYESSALRPYERKIVQLLVSGMCLREIAETRGVTYGTLKNQMRSIYTYYGVRNQAQLIVAAIREGDAMILPETPFPLDQP